MKLWILTSCCLLLCWNAFPQVPSLPRPGDLSPYQPSNVSPSPSSNTKQQQLIHQQNQTLQQEQNRQEYNQQLLMKDAPETRYQFRSFSYIPETKLYYQAFDELEQMLRGSKPLSLKSAVFLVEHAFLGNRIQKEWYNNVIANHTDIIFEALQKEGYREDDSMAKKMLLHRFMSDTINICGEDGSICNTSYPKRYDFEDIYGRESWPQMFVTKLLSTNTGQCHSLPLLYLILAEDLGIDAYLAFSPEHSYIKLQDERGEWYNLELTNGHYSTDAWVMGSGYVKAEALSTGIYMNPMNRKAVIAHCLVDLAKGYTKKFGYDPFVLKCVETALRYSPKNIFAHLLRSDYYTLLFEGVHQQLGKPSLKQLLGDQKAIAIYNKRNTIYDQIDAMGYEPMPEAIYKKWLQSLNHHKNLQASFPKP